MIYLKAANYDDICKEYEFIRDLPKDENGFTNPNFGCSFEEFRDRVLRSYIDHAQGKNLPEGYVPGTQFFLWDDDEIVGLFRVRHYLNDFLANGPGHIGYGIKKECRGKGYASEGLRLALEEAKKLIKEDEAYLSVHKDNPASLRVQLKNGAIVHHEDDKEFFTRIRIR
jgi:predicted acetyltransferase